MISATNDGSEDVSTTTTKTAAVKKENPSDGEHFDSKMLENARQLASLAITE